MRLRAKEYPVPWLAGLSLVEGVANLAISIALAIPLGVVGVALGTAIPALIVHFLFIPRVVLKRYGIAWGAFMRHAWARPLALGVATWALLQLVPLDAGEAPGWFLLVGLALGTAALFGILWLLSGRFMPSEASPPTGPPRSSPPRHCTTSSRVTPRTPCWLGTQRTSRPT